MILQRIPAMPEENSMAAAQNIDRLLRLDEVLHTTGLGRNTVYRRIREGTFPKQVRIGPNSVAWRQSEIARWITDLSPSND
ncbi:AlpA family transcriptional regulator [Pseudomonas syringae pv. actinidifoliorum]|nr:AlpA family transcriptional regulator [Pseudomonas syringae pv. actinidifoliorum]MDU8522654.1 AlpA family transcriptional regulator [Pseudomonas syringae pv. actinidifoliorum]MDU8529270.1 AlpA family transcriptional regulator [Pseudomonas syringae pv. actinidifoliorum]